MKNEEYMHDTAEIKTTQTPANGATPPVGNNGVHPYTDLIGTAAAAVATTRASAPQAG